MKPETRLRKALARTVGGMVECANEIVIQATDYQSEPVDERYAPVVRLLRKLIKDGAKVLAQTKEEGGR
jgi:hypothetical protein